MLKELVRFFSKEKKPNRGQNSRSRSYQEANEQVVTDTPIKKLHSSISGVGNEEYPILSSDYSPNSRIPCTDLVPFISDRIISNDIGSIKLVMREVIEANQGLGIGPSWIDKCIDDLLSIDFNKYINFPSARALAELKAAFIVVSKNGGGKQFLISDYVPKLISGICFAYNPKWQEEIKSLEVKANTWISQMAEDTPFWDEYGELTLGKPSAFNIDKTLLAKVAALSPAARLQLIYAIERGGGSLYNLTSYQIRNLGININSTSQELIDSELLSCSSSLKAIESEHTKQELIALCEEYNVDYRKSWKKEKLVTNLTKNQSELINKLARKKLLVSPNYDAYPSLKEVPNAVESHKAGFSLLCFI